MSKKFNLKQAIIDYQKSPSFIDWELFPEWLVEEIEDTSICPICKAPNFLAYHRLEKHPNHQRINLYLEDELNDKCAECEGSGE